MPDRLHSLPRQLSPPQNSPTTYHPSSFDLATVYRLLVRAYLRKQQLLTQSARSTGQKGVATA